MGCLATLVALGLFCFLVAGGFGYWVFTKTRQDPLFIIKEYPGFVRSTSTLILDPFHSDEPLDIEEYAFDSAAYDSFMQKQTALVEVFQNSQIKNSPFEGLFTAQELMTFVMADLANLGIRRYRVEFLENQARIQASVPAQSLKKFLPEGQPELFYQIYDTLQYINLDLDLQVGWGEEGLNPLRIQNVRLGDITMPQAFVDMSNESLNLKKTGFSNQIRAELAKKRLALKSAGLTPEGLKFSGLWNIE